MTGDLLKGYESFISKLKWCLSISWETSKLYTIARISFEIIRPLLAVITTFIFKLIIDILTGSVVEEGSVNRLLALFSCALLVSLFRSVVIKGSQYCQSMHNEQLNSKISLMIMDRSLTIDLEYFDNPEYYDQFLSTNKSLYALSEIIWNTLSVVSALISFMTVFALLMRENGFYGVFMLITAIPSSLTTVKYTRLLYKLNLEQINQERHMNYCQNIASDKNYSQDMRLYNSGEIIKNHYIRIRAKLISKRQRFIKKRSINTLVLDCLPEVTILVIGIDIALKVLSKTLTVGDYSFYTGLITQLWSAITALISSTIQIYDNKLSVDNIKALDQYKNRVIDCGEEHLSEIESIEFDHVSFTYPSAKSPALNDISFILNKKEKVAFVGLNGSGKSTLIKLLLRFYETDEGIIKINGRDIRSYRLKEIRSNFSVYFQDMKNYCFTLKDNFDIVDAEREDLEASAFASLRVACGQDIIEKAQNNLDTSLTRFFDTNGIELSGGQHQKLAIARALYRNSTAVILDEPSSNLDPKAEHHIFEMLNGITANKMTIFTSHRLSNTSLADRIIVLEEGRIIESGSQEELIQNNQRYAELFRYQQEKYSI